MSVHVVMESVYAEEPWTIDKQDLVRIVLTCALHGQDCDLDAPWASQEGSATATSILSSIAKALYSSRRGRTVHQSPRTAPTPCALKHAVAHITIQHTCLSHDMHLQSSDVFLRGLPICCAAI